jgi:hypothetical protein
LQDFACFDGGKIDLVESIYLCTEKKNEKSPDPCNSKANINAMAVMIDGKQIFVHPSKPCSDDKASKSP